MLDNSKKDFWDKAQVLAPFFLGLVGLFFTAQLGILEEKNRKAEQELQSLIQREQSERDFRGNMFPLLLERLQDANISVFDRIIFLRLFRESFPEIFESLGPSFIPLLMKETSNLEDIEERSKSLFELYSLAQAITKNQIANLNPLINRDIRITEGETKEINFKDADNHAQSFTITLKNVSDNHVGITLTKYSESKTLIALFDLTFVDTPLRNYTSLQDGRRISLLLQSTELHESSRSANIKIMIY